MVYAIMYINNINNHQRYKNRNNEDNINEQKLIYP